jgi:peptidyl-prolyl cis-trans isomerase C
MLRIFCVVLVSLSLAATLPAQGTLPAPGKAKPAAIVNGREIPESAVQRALKPIAKEHHEKARAQIITALIDDALVDYYLELLKIVVEPKEVDAQLETIKKDIVESKQEYAKVLEKMEITEPEFKKEIHNQLRWEKFVTQQGTDEKLKRLFDSSPEIFDGSTVRARHILVAPETADEKGKAAAIKKLQDIKATVAAATSAAASKMPPDADNLTKQKILHKATDDAFAAAAKEHSICPTKQDGGTLREFPRMGMMVEPFAKAAFALDPYQLSEPVETAYGVHLILVTGKKPGEAVKFEAMKGAVIEVYASRLREAIIEKMKADANTKIEVVK